MDDKLEIQTESEPVTDDISPHHASNSDVIDMVKHEIVNVDLKPIKEDLKEWSSKPNLRPELEPTVESEPTTSTFLPYYAFTTIPKFHDMVKEEIVHVEYQPIKVEPDELPYEPTDDQHLLTELESGELNAKGGAVRAKRTNEGQTSESNLQTNKRKEFRKCNICDLKYSCSYTLRTHMMSHAGQKLYQCSRCSYRCVTTFQLADHGRCHPSNEKPFKCEFCDRRFSCGATLKAHNAVHAKENVTCEQCRERFPKKSRAQVEYHARNHAAEHFECEICDSTFTSLQSLEEHVRSFTGELPYKCAVCKQKFARKKEVKEHNRHHAKEDRYKCNVCSYKCAKIKDLRAHIRRHQEERHKCDECDYRCANMKDLRGHVRSHKEKYHKCDVCDYKSTRISDLRVHRRSHKEGNVISVPFVAQNP